MDRKKDLENDIKDVYELVREYEQKISLADDPKAKRRYRREVDEGWKSIDSRLLDYLRLCRKSGTVPPKDIQQLINSRNIDDDAESDEADKDSEQVVVLSERVAGIESARMSEDIVPVQEHRTELFDVLTSCFDKGELRTLCFRLKVDYDDLPGEGKAEKARELILFLERSNRLSDLLRLIRDRRPDISQSEKPNESVSICPEPRDTAPDPPRSSSVLKKWQVLVVSSNDVAEEREQLKEIVSELNQGEMRFRDIYIELIDWQDDIVPEMGQPTRVVLDQLKIEELDLLILILWQGLGELAYKVFAQAYSSYESRHWPQIAVYRCVGRMDPRQIEREEWERLDLFLKDFRIGQYSGVFKEYEKVNEFRRYIRKDMLSLLRKYKYFE